MKAIDILRKVDQAAEQEAIRDEIIYEAIPVQVYSESAAEKREVRVALMLLGLAGIGCAMCLIFDGWLGGAGGLLLLYSAICYSQSRILT